MAGSPARCSLCDGRLREETSTYTQEIGGSIALVTDVPVLACPQCGEQYFTPETVDRLQALISDGRANKQIPRTIEVPVYSFSSA